MVDPSDFQGISTSSNSQTIKKINNLALAQGLTRKQISQILPKCLERITSGEQLEKVVLEEILQIGD